jgi:hypothetical protein
MINSDLKINTAIFLKKLGLLPRRFNSRLDNIIVSRKLNAEMWDWRKLKYSSKGYWVVDPMPTKSELNNYYSSYYWVLREGKKCLVSPRDLDHFLEIREKYPQKVFKKILNFGAGHGGISILFHMAGAEVTNVEPSDLDLGLDWKHLRQLEDVAGTYDLIYGSHSLEHVTDVTHTFRVFETLLEPEGVFYFEVPNCHPDNSESYPNGSLYIPHTYYFTREFFSSLPYQKILNSTYLYSKGKTSFTKVNDDSGHVIRFSGLKLE